MTLTMTDPQAVADVIGAARDVVNPHTDHPDAQAANLTRLEDALHRLDTATGTTRLDIITAARRAADAIDRVYDLLLEPDGIPTGAALLIPEVDTNALTVALVDGHDLRGWLDAIADLD